ncbi:MAG TPA: NADH:flavin oxidoreductase/NADH oxidase, partial [Rhodocyclaceae bacterium]|nr:NADH:flavin oxidoreductase/NADH oxidase [Rhodocyclaceae bacterium]
MSQLFTPYALGPLQLENRIAIAPMCQYSAVEGDASDWHMMHLGNLSLSGAGLLIIEATAVLPEGRISAKDLGLWSESNETALARVLKAIRSYSDIPVAIQIAHAGRKASSAVPWEGGHAIPPGHTDGWQTFAPSAVPHAQGEPLPVALDAAGLLRVKDAFVATAKRAHRLGIDAIEVHGAHGYLLHQFLSPLANQRTDEYGGSLENRMRFPLEVFAAVRAAFPNDKPVGMRISATDWVEGGWNLEQSVALAGELKKLGADFIHVSSGGVSPLQKIPLGPNYQIPFAEHIKLTSGLPTI